MKNILIRFVNGFCYSVAITTVIELIVMKMIGHVAMLPEFAAHYENDVIAFRNSFNFVTIKKASNSIPQNGL